jgi:hypothetical protein
MIFNGKIKAKGAALVMTVLLLGFFSLMALAFSAMISLHLDESRNHVLSDMLENGEDAVLAHALALCDSAPKNEGLYKTFSSGWQNDDGGSVAYRFRFEDQMQSAENVFPNYPPLTSLRDASGNEMANLAVLDAEEENSLKITKACEDYLGEKGEEERAPQLAASLLDELDVDRSRRSDSLLGESLVFTGVVKGDNRFLPYWKVDRLSAFFDLDKKTLEPYRGFMVLKTAYEERGGETNLFVTLTEKPYGKIEKEQWDKFCQEAGRERIGSLWQDWGWVGETVSFLSSCGGKYISAKILEARKDGFLLEGKPEVTMGSTVTRSWCSDREESGALSLQKRDLWVLEGLQTNYSYRVKLRVLDGEAKPAFASGSALTGGYYRVASGKYGSLPFVLDKRGERTLVMGMEAYSPSYYHFANVSSNALHLASWAIFCETPEGEKRVVTPRWTGTPLLMPGAEAVLASWFEDKESEAVSGYALPSSWAVPAKVSGVRVYQDREGWKWELPLNTASEHPRSDRHSEYSVAYLKNGHGDDSLTPFPIISQKGSALTLFMGNRDNVLKFLSTYDMTVYLGDFALESLRNEVYLIDQWGQKTALLNRLREIPKAAGYHRAEESKIAREELLGFLKKMRSRKIDLPFSAKDEVYAETRFKATPISDNKLTLGEGASFRENLLKGCDLITKEGEIFRITASMGATVTLDRKHGLKGGEEVTVSPDGKEAFLLSQSGAESVWLLKLPPEAILPADLYLPGHAPFPNAAPPRYSVSVYNREKDLWEPRLKNAAFPEGGVLHLGRLGDEHRLKDGTVKLKIYGGGAESYWLRQPFAVPDNFVRKSTDERCDSFTVYYEVKATDKSEIEPITRKGAFLIQRRWRRNELHPKSFFAAKSHLFKPFE